MCFIMKKRDRQKWKDVRTHANLLFVVAVVAMLPQDTNSYLGFIIFHFRRRVYCNPRVRTRIRMETLSRRLIFCVVMLKGGEKGSSPYFVEKWKRLYCCKKCGRRAVGHLISRGQNIVLPVALCPDMRVERGWNIVCRGEMGPGGCSILPEEEPSLIARPLSTSMANLRTNGVRVHTNYSPFQVIPFLGQLIHTL